MPAIFFSSRRRHTRSLCDWSSDVCSSDLVLLARDGCGWWGADSESRVMTVNVRSEERRVGKECRSGCASLSEKKKDRELGKTSYGLVGWIGRPSEMLKACQVQQLERYCIP